MGIANKLTNIIYIDIASLRRRRRHPTDESRALSQWILNLYANPLTHMSRIIKSIMARNRNICARFAVLVIAWFVVQPAAQQTVWHTTAIIQSATLATHTLTHSSQMRDSRRMQLQCCLPLTRCNFMDMYESVPSSHWHSRILDEFFVFFFPFALHLFYFISLVCDDCHCRSACSGSSSCFSISLSRERARARTQARSRDTFTE